MICKFNHIIFILQAPAAAPFLYMIPLKWTSIIYKLWIFTIHEYARVHSGLYNWITFCNPRQSNDFNVYSEAQHRVFLYCSHKRFEKNNAPYTRFSTLTLPIKFTRRDKVYTVGCCLRPWSNNHRKPCFSFSSEFVSTFGVINYTPAAESGEMRVAENASLPLALESWPMFLITG